MSRVLWTLHRYLAVSGTCGVVHFGSFVVVGLLECLTGEVLVLLVFDFVCWFPRLVLCGFYMFGLLIGLIRLWMGLLVLYLWFRGVVALVTAGVLPWVV